ncbi:MAG: luxO [Devosia sp.]|uniref:sigma-54-dependent transcriptional regulator n=1 Tax=Devosia sp. TaxID=1871048 RepID=UPI0026337CD3|nr:sigma-54 dependent transcriptional regulator [Devosia sp.]MDB5538407.1 luxO [Devosia sp.]
MPAPGFGQDNAARILLVDRDAAGCAALIETLSGCLVVPPVIAEARSGRQAADRLRAGRFDVLLVDLGSVADLSAEAEDAVARLVRLSAGALVIALSDGASVTATLSALRAGAHDHIVRPLGGRAFAARVGELAQRHGKTHALSLDPRTDERTERYAGFIGASNQMQVVYEQIERVAASTAPVFITGESGTGKDLCAEALHERSTRAHRRFVAVDCAAVPQELMEAELFGVVSGAMTGSGDDRKGAAELADGGTLFLDEIGAIDLSLQGKLMRFLQTGTISRLGETGVRRLDVRLICATSRNPMQLIAERKFREDLFYRLHVLPIHLPPLRQRPSDILVLARHFLERFAVEEGKRFDGFSAEVASQLVAHEWPGNVRQLQTLIHRLVVMFDGGEIDGAMLALADLDAPIPTTTAQPALLPRRQTILPMWQQEQRIIEEAIESFSGNIALAAQALELSPSTIYRKRQAWAELEGKKGAA